MRITSLLAALLVSLLMAGATGKAHAGLFISITVAPPPLPVYVQPPIPGPGYMWTPGYWSWEEDESDYYWVPGAWVPAPEPGLLWTPGYWGWSNGVYAWNAGYWGPHVGFYGGVSYGFGYTGVGFAGGAWSGGVFSYNRSVTNIGASVSITNVYNKTVINNNVTNVSFNGGNGGVKAQPTAQELAAANEHHVPPTHEQLQHHQLASKNPDLKFAKNHGKPSIAATSKAGDFSKGHVFGAKSAGGPVKPVSLRHDQALHHDQNLHHDQALHHDQNLHKAPDNQSHGDNKKGLHSPKAATLNPVRRPGPPPGPRPGPHPVNKQPPHKDKKPG